LNLRTTHPKSVAKKKKRSQTFNTAKLWFFGDRPMKQAKSLTDTELRRVLDYIATRRHAARNRAMLLLTHWAGLRVGEVAALRVRDVLDADGAVRAEITLAPDQTKGSESHVVFLNQKLRKELTAYIKATRFSTHPRTKLFGTQQRPIDGFDANTLCQHFHYLYRRAGIAGASSHSGRRSFITNLASKGVGVRVLASLARHKSISTTQRYIDVNDDQKRKAVELV
jgi:integrase/recombinase XerD